MYKPLTVFTLVVCGAFPAGLFAMQLITDAHFQTGVKVLNQNSSVGGVIQYTTANGAPAWDLAQWNTKGSILGATPTQLPAGVLKWQNAYKDLVMGPPNTVNSQLILSVDSTSEYNGIYRVRGAPWPHLLVQQSISEPG